MKELFRKRVGNYFLGRTLGEGTYAKVKYGQQVDTGEVVAIKVLDKDKLYREGMIDQIKREIAIMKDLHHPNIVDLKEVMASKDKIYMVMEFMPGGELFDKIVAEGPLDEDAARKVFQQMLDALDYCHKLGIFHRDLKPENVLLSSNGEVKLSDFGLGALPESTLADGMLRTTCGTPNYVAPEVLARKGYAGGPADIWSLGVCLYVITAGALPFDEPNLGALFSKISRADYHTPAWFSEELAHLLHAIINPRPNERPTIDQLRQHPWVVRDYVMAQPRDPVPKSGTDNDLFEPTVDPKAISKEESRKASLMRRRTSTLGEERWFMAPGTHMNAFQLINAALDISALFEARKDVISRATRFTSKAPPHKILERVEGAVAKLGGTCKRRPESSRMRITLTGRRGAVEMTVEVMSILRGVHLVDASKVTGDSVDFYNAYAQITDIIKPLITADALRRPEEGGSKEGGFPANVFSMTLTERMKLSKGLKKMPPAAYTMSAADRKGFARLLGKAIKRPSSTSDIPMPAEATSPAASQFPPAYADPSVPPAFVRASKSGVAAQPPVATAELSAEPLLDTNFKLANGTPAPVEGISEPSRGASADDMKS
ncbi:CBL-interacting protein kinase 23 [Coccomyxa sp. Obi]|nr:CBL-interacting protein kinase 23 [Coccomyxa sp. Obi]